MSESRYRQMIIADLRILHPVAVENSIGPGTPDINCSLGWIELKWMKSYPKEGIIKIKHFTPQQRVWLLKRWRNCRGAWLLFKIGQDQFLFDGETASREVGKTLDRDGFIEKSLVYFPSGTYTPKELIICLKTSMTP